MSGSEIAFLVLVVAAFAALGAALAFASWQDGRESRRK